MHTLRYCHAILLVMGCIGLVIPDNLCAQEGSQIAAAGTSARHTLPVVRDVALGPDHALRGILLGPNAERVSDAVVVLARDRLEIGRTSTDRQGRFEFPDLRGGVCSLSVGQSSQLFRVWTAQAAPPRAAPEVVLVTDELIQRGQRPFCELFVCDPIVLGVILAAAIAIPVAVHNSRSERPAS